MLTLLDVTLREAGIANRFSFTLSQVAAIVQALDEAGMDIIEVGYLRPSIAKTNGASCGPEYLDVVRQNCRRAKLSIMIHIQDVTLACYRDLQKRGISIVRFPVSPSELGALRAHADAARDAGLLITLNAIRATELSFADLLSVAEAAEGLGARCFYIADSNGSLYPERVCSLNLELRKHTRIPLGFHAHDNISLAFANTLSAIQSGVEWIDASLGGAGKGGGNLMTELIAGYLAVNQNRPFDIFELGRAYASQVAPTLSADKWTHPSPAVSGLLDMNIDQIAELQFESERRDVPVEELLASVYAARVQLERQQNVRYERTDMRVYGQTNL